MNRKTLFFFFITFTASVLHGCITLLPSTKDITRTHWKSFQEIKEAYSKVTPNETTISQLKKLGFDLYSSPNVRVLNYIDIAVATQSIKREDLNGGLRECIKAKDNCRGYSFEPRVIRSERVGNFWLDILNFQRKTKGTGWEFKATFLIVDDVVIEKLWNGNPLILEERETKNPLGPFQEGGGYLLKLIP